MNKFSIILPVRNGGSYIKDCVNSILAQKLQDFNLIVLDNCSTDGTREWLVSLNSEKIIIYPSKESLSIEENWARAVTVPKNEFITLIGHDDILHPEYLFVIDKLIRANPDAGLYQTHFNFIDDKGDIIRPCIAMESKILPAMFLQNVLRNKIEITGTGFMMRSVDYDRNGGIPSYPNLLYADIEIFIELIKTSCLVVAPENTFDFRFHMNNTSKSGGLKRIEAFEKMIDYLKKLETEKEEFTQVIQENAIYYLKSHVIGACHKLIYVPKNNRDNVTMELIIESAKKCSQKLLPGIQFLPEKFRAIRLAKLIDSNIFLRRLFLFYKSFQKRTF
jgi:glycosyltransferase involved in cell wall biosynthesis